MYSNYPAMTMLYRHNQQQHQGQQNPPLGGLPPGYPQPPPGMNPRINPYYQGSYLHQQFQDGLPSSPHNPGANSRVMPNDHNNQILPQGPLWPALPNGVKKEQGCGGEEGLINPQPSFDSIMEELTSEGFNGEVAASKLENWFAGTMLAMASNSNSGSGSQGQDIGPWASNGEFVSDLDSLNESKPWLKHPPPSGGGNSQLPTAASSSNNSNSASPGSTHGIKTEEEENLTTKLEKERRKRREEREAEERQRKEAKPELEIPQSDLALATVPGMNFDPTSRAFSDEELKPQPIIRKRRKVSSSKTRLKDRAGHELLVFFPCSNSSRRRPRTRATGTGGRRTT